MTSASMAGARTTPRFDPDLLSIAAIGGVVAILLLIFVAAPLAAIFRLSFVTPDGIGLGNYAKYLSGPKFGHVVGNSFAVGMAATAATIVLAYAFAYAMRRSVMPGKRVFGLLILLPLFSPSLVQALGMLFLFGRNGIINRTFGLDIDIYGFWGIVISDIFYALPHAYLILSAALAAADARLYESARMLGATGTQMFRTITLPATKYGLLSATFVVFTIVITDFGNPMVIGGDYSVLATEIYNQVSGQANLSMGAVIGVLLLVPAALAVAAERWIMRHGQATINERSQPLELQRHRGRDRAAFGFSLVLCGAIVLVVAVVVLASFVKLWPYNLHMTLRHYQFDVQNGLQPLWTSIGVSLLAGVIGVVVTIAAACSARRIGGLASRVLYLLSILPAAVPGMVLGLGYVLVFNDPDNPLEILYGTFVILAICTVYHYHAQGYLIAATRLEQVSKVFDEASTALGGGFLRTLRAVTLPIIAPAIASIGVFFFVRSMVTLSALIFVVTPKTQVAAVSVLLLDDAGNSNQAAAYSVCIMVVVAMALGIFQLALRWSGRERSH